MATTATAFTELFLRLVEESARTATYKLAVLLALLDLCVEYTDRSGAPPAMVTTHQLAEKVIDLYWLQVAPYGTVGILRQTSGRPGQRAAILMAVQGLRERGSRMGLSSSWQARTALRREWRSCVAEVEWVLAKWPLPRVQNFGSFEHRFLFEIAWDEKITKTQFRRGEVSHNISLLQGVPEHLVALHGLLRPLLQHHWTMQVARLNRLEQADLLDHLFGRQRRDLAPLRAPLRELQWGRCFYCQGQVTTSASQVDHFLPWSRYSDDGIDNLVLAHGPCNHDKRAFLAATPHVERWVGRSAPDLHAIALEAGWERDPRRTMSLARAAYLRLSPDTRLWAGRGAWTTPDAARLAGALEGA